MIADDLDRKKLAKEGTPVSFKAFIQVKGQEIQVLDQAFIIGHDCRHIIKMGGPDQINLNCTDLVKCAMDNDSGMCDATIPKAYFDKASGKCRLSFGVAVARTHSTRSKIVKLVVANDFQLYHY